MSVTIYIKNPNNGGGWVDGLSMNVSSRNFGTLWSALGFPVDFSGEMDGRKLSKALDVIDTDLALRQYRTDDNFVDFGISRQQVDRYVIALKRLAIAAEKMELPMAWA